MFPLNRCISPTNFLFLSIQKGTKLILPLLGRNDASSSHVVIVQVRVLTGNQCYPQFGKLEESLIQRLLITVLSDCKEPLRD